MVSRRSKKQSDSIPRRRQVVDSDGFSISSATSDKKPAIRVPRQTESSADAGRQSQFRRNQTLSSYRHNTPDESSRQKVHHLALQRRKLGGLFFMVAIVAVFLLLLLWQLAAQIHITATTKQLSAQFDSSKYEAAINDYLNINPAQRLRFVMNEADLSGYVSSVLPEVSSLKMGGSSSIGQADFTITFREPVAGWIMNGKQYYVDTDGIVFEKNYYIAPTVQIVDESGVNAGQGTAVAGSRLLGFLGRVVAQAGERGYTVTQAMLPQGTTREVDVRVKESTTRIKFSIDRGAGEQVEDMDRSVKFLSAKGVVPEYIDVRVSGRATYK